MAPFEDPSLTIDDYLRGKTDLFDELQKDILNDLEDDVFDEDEFEKNSMFNSIDPNDSNGHPKVTQETIDNSSSRRGIQKKEPFAPEQVGEDGVTQFETSSYQLDSPSVVR